MEITIFKKPVDGMLNLKVSLYEITDDLGKSVDISIWVTENDSRTVLEKSAREAAITQLKRALFTLENESH